jgi:hypothetical protein
MPSGSAGGASVTAFGKSDLCCVNRADRAGPERGPGALQRANRLDLSVVKPDFVPVSWYKPFGYPTGVGRLIARREALGRLRRPSIDSWPSWR